MRKYAFRNADAAPDHRARASLGAVIAGALVTEIVFSYPGLGYQIYRAIINEDYFVIQGIFLFIIIGVLIANFLVDIVYVSSTRERESACKVDRHEPSNRQRSRRPRHRRHVASGPAASTAPVVTRPEELRLRRTVRRSPSRAT